MPPPSLAELTAAAAAADDPSFTPASRVKIGGVDPLGLRQINFDLMDRVFPALNNVARHLRPFVVVAWACRRATDLATKQGADRIAEEDLLDFVNRIEVVYTWSQLLRNPDADLPGRQFLGPLLRAERWVFGGTEWKKLCTQRRDSTAFTAAINYGPSLKALGWVHPHQRYPRVLLANDEAGPALDAFEAAIADRLDHPAFSQFGAVEVQRSEGKAWSESWALENPTNDEKAFMAKVIAGGGAPLSRQHGCALMLAAARYAASVDTGPIRAAMTGAPSNFVAADDLHNSLHSWRRVQVRQLFRLSLEALLYWILRELDGGSKPTEILVNAFISQTAPRSARGTAREWLDASNVANAAPTALMSHITDALDEAASGTLASAIMDGLVFCLAEPSPYDRDHEPEERLPISRAQREAQARADGPARDFVRHLFESWVLAQHAYWSIGRALADARARGKSILRLKVILEEGGWTSMPGVSRGAPPVPTPDRLETALTLAKECGLLADVGMSPEARH